MFVLQSPEGAVLVLLCLIVFFYFLKQRVTDIYKVLAQEVNVPKREMKKWKGDLA